MKPYTSITGSNWPCTPFTNMNNSQRRIALVCFSLSLGGLELSTLRLAKAMNSRGAYAMVVVPSSSPLQQRAIELGIDLATLVPRWKYGDIPAALRLAEILKNNGIERVVLMQSQDIVHVLPLRLRHRIRLCGPPRTQPDAGGQAPAGPLSGRPDQRHHRLRGGRRQGCGGAERRAPPPGPSAASPATKPISA